MTYEKIIIGIGILIGISLLRKTNPIFLKSILIGLILSFGLSFFSEKLLINISFFSFGILTFLFTVYNGLKKRWLNLTIGFFAFISFLFSFLHYPFANELKLLMLIPILSYLAIFKSLDKHKSELSILTMLVSYELNEFLRLTEQWIN